MKVRQFAAALVLSTLTAPAFSQDFSGASIIAQADKNGDKMLDLEEWNTLPFGAPFPVEGDANKDNKIDVAELDVLIAQYMGGGAPPPPPSAPAQAPAAPAPAAP